MLFLLCENEIVNKGRELGQCAVHEYRHAMSCVCLVLWKPKPHERIPSATEVNELSKHGNLPEHWVRGGFSAIFIV